jgi:hypothetical protein
MKTFKAICAASVIALSLSIPAYAEDPAPGDVHVPGSPPPATCGTETDPTAPCELTDETAAGDCDISFSALADLLWTLVF